MSAFPLALPTGLAAADLLPAVLPLLPGAVACLTPVLDAAGHSLDWQVVALNEAAASLPEPAQALATYHAVLQAAYQHQTARSFDWLQPGGASRRATVQPLGRQHLLLTLAPEQEAEAVQAAQRERDAAWDEALRLRARLRGLIEQAPALVNTQLGPEHVFELVHPLTYQLLGQRPLEGLPSRQALPELEGPFHELLDQVYQTGRPFHGREVPARLDRQGTGELSEAYFDFTYQPLLNAGGQVEGVLTFAVEVTEQVQARRRAEQLYQELEARVVARTAQARTAQAEAAAQRQRLESLFLQAPILLASLTGPRHVVELANAGFQAVFGNRPLLGRPYAEGVPELVAQGFIALLDGVYATGVPYVGRETPVFITRPDGQVPGAPQYFTFIYQPTRAADGVVDGILIVAYEVTEQVQARQQVQQLNRELSTANAELLAGNQHLRRVNQELDSFVYIASHDLKSPIANLEGLVLALRKELAPAVAAEPVTAHLLTLLEQSTGRFRLTLDQLTGLIRAQHPAADVGAAPAVDLAGVVASVRPDLEPGLTTSAAEVQLDVAACPVVYAEPETLRSLVYNLLSNALKYRHPDRVPRVRLRTRCQAGEVVLTVKDNGLGLSVEQQGKLFGLFRRLHTHVEGSGLGLYTVKRLVENAGGTIAVKSTLGVGTTFTVRLPQPLAPFPSLPVPAIH